MNKPEVRIVQNQEIQNSNPHVDSWEAEQLLRKYGYNQESTNQQPSNEPGLTFEEMIAQEELRIKQERIKRQQQIDNSNGYKTETTYSTDEESGFSFKIQISTDMSIPKNY